VERKSTWRKNSLSNPEQAMTKWAVLCAGVTLAASCASAPAAPRAVDPVGAFDFTTSMEGTEVTGTIEIQRADGGGYTGTLSTNVAEPMPLSSVTVDGQKMTVVADAPDGPVTMVLTFVGNDFTGNWTYTTLAGTATGRRRT
jgi:hypothetical protein